MAVEAAMGESRRTILPFFASDQFSDRNLLPASYTLSKSRPSIQASLTLKRSGNEPEFKNIIEQAKRDIEGGSTLCLKIYQI